MSPAFAMLLLAVAGPAQSEQPRKAFVTSSTGSTNLGSWEDAGGATGLAAADAICQARAADAGLANPGNFVAWISGNDDDAYCRVHGLNGKKSASCGQAALPVAAGPWVRTDGQPFAAAIDRMLLPDLEIYTSPRFDEFGVRLGPSPFMATATSANGVLAQSSCSEWTNADPDQFILMGVATAVGEAWTASLGTECAVSAVRLLCLERLPGPAVAPPSSPGRAAFVSSIAGSGQLGSWAEAEPGSSGVAAADSICRRLAGDAGLRDPGSFKAWLSDGSINAIDRFDNDGPWVRTDGVPIAQSRAELTSFNLFTGLALDEFGQAPVDAPAWTGSFGSGTASAQNCQAWSSSNAADSGTVGLSDRADSAWTFWTSSACNRERRLYCLSDVAALGDPVFQDRFESP